MSGLASITTSDFLSCTFNNFMRTLALQNSQVMSINSPNKWNMASLLKTILAVSFHLS
jgi:hypothetical protein